MSKVIRKYIAMDKYSTTAALQSVGCLDFLHGKSGTVNNQAKPGWVIDLERFQNLKINYQEGKVVLPDGCIMKFGKWLRKNKMGFELQEFEKRQQLRFIWRISTTPSDILGMSYDRVWTSCMRPDGEYKCGPLSDCQAGSAIILFFRPGADKPCGREILRPAVRDGKPVIIRGGTIYGNGTKIDAKEITTEIEIVSSVELGDIGIFADVYFDCRRDLFYEIEKISYEEAEAALLAAFGKWIGKNVPDEAKKYFDLKPIPTVKGRKPRCFYRRNKKKQPAQVQPKQPKFAHVKQKEYAGLHKQYGNELQLWLQKINCLSREINTILSNRDFLCPWDLLQFPRFDSRDWQYTLIDSIQELVVSIPIEVREFKCFNVAEIIARIHSYCPVFVSRRTR